MSVIVSRALPDVRDGLKPVHRRILFAMMEGGPPRPTGPDGSRAAAVGDVIKKYHPHGDRRVRRPGPHGPGLLAAVPARRSARETSAPSTAIRQRRCATQKPARPDCDGDAPRHRQGDRRLHPQLRRLREEPVVLPARFPNLLVNGSSGIAVGMATNIPPHNLGEVIDGVIAIIDDPEHHRRRADEERQGT